MRIRTVGVVGLVAATAIVPDAAQGATVGFNPPRSCYREGTQVAVGAGPFQPFQPVSITLDGAPLGSGTANAQGLVAGGLRLGTIQSAERKRTVTVTQTTNPALTGSATFTQTKVYVASSPKRFRPGKALRLRAGGFYGVGGTLYAHVRGPRKRNLRVGRLKGACGKTRAARRLLRRGDPPGSYPVQFDTRRRFQGRRVPLGVRRLYSITRRILRPRSNASTALAPAVASMTIATGLSLPTGDRWSSSSGGHG